MARPVNSSVSVSWKNEPEKASEIEFLQWFYQNSEGELRSALSEHFKKSTGKALPDGYKS